MGGSWCEERRRYETRQDSRLGARDADAWARDDDAVHDPEEALLASARNGDAAAVEQLLTQHLPALRAYVRSHLPARLRALESGSDLVNSVCREVLQAQEGFEYRGPEAFRGWLYTWAWNKIRDRLRYWAAEKRAPGHDCADSAASISQLAEVYKSCASPSGAAVRNEEILLLEEALERLPEDFREVIALCHLAGLSREEAGARLGGRSAGAVRVLLNRAMVALSTEMEKLGLR